MTRPSIDPCKGSIPWGDELHESALLGVRRRRSADLLITFIVPATLDGLCMLGYVART